MKYKLDSESFTKVVLEKQKKNIKMISLKHCLHYYFSHLFRNFAPTLNNSFDSLVNINIFYR